MDQSRFFSIKWEVVAALSFVLLIFNGALSFVSYQNLKSQFVQQRDAIYKRHNAEIVALLDKETNNLLSLSSQIPLLADQGRAGEGSVEDLATALDRHWQILQLEWGLEAGAIYGLDGELVQRWGSKAPSVAQSWARKVSETRYPVNAINCEFDCLHYVVSPAMVGGAYVGVLLIASDSVDSVLTMQAISQSIVGIVSEVKPELASTLESSEFSDIRDWGVRVHAMTDRSSSVPLLKKVAEEHPFRYLLDEEPRVIWQGSYELSVFPIATSGGPRAYALLLEDIATENLRIGTATRQSIGIGVAGLLVSELLLLLVLWRPTSHLQRQAEVLPLLAKSAFEKVRESLDNRQNWGPLNYRNELDILDQTAIELSYQLESLEKTVIERTEELRDLALNDSLTGLANRRFCTEMATNAVHLAKRNGQAIALLFIDLDYFKKINDSLGHEIGDRVLKLVAERLRSCVRPSDTVARLGGDEFVILLQNINESRNAGHVAEKVLERLAAPMHIADYELFVSGSIGIVLAPQDGDRSDELIRRADMAMYKAKERGRNKYQFFTQSMHDEASESLTLENDLRHAIDEQEFVLHYQPKIDLKSNRIVGAEALVRWQSSRRGGMVFPDVFIPVLEETGLILPLGEWVFKQACAQVSEWRKTCEESVCVAINLSPRQFADPRLRETLERIIESEQVSPEDIEIEITESMLAEDYERAVEVLNSLREVGVALSIDDFGTGYSSLAHLKRFPVNALKVDREFVRNIPEDKEDMEITSAVIAMAHKLGLKVVAEGVENQEHVEFLRENRCDYGQGYLYSKPIAPEQFEDLLKRDLSLAG